MMFGAVPVADAAGAILAHSVAVPGGRLRKGLTLGPADVARLQEAGLAVVTVARLGPGDIHENDAAARLAAALVPDPIVAGLRLTDPFTGRVNVIAEGPGIAILDVDAIEAFNRVHPMITIATVPPWQQMRPGGMVATIKIISYAVPQQDVERAADLARDALCLAGPVYREAGLVITEIDGGPDSAGGQRAIADRVAALGMGMTDILHVPHDSSALADAIQHVGGDIVLILTGSATSDIDDVAPASVRAAGGRVDRFGMPVDPGNLLFLGELKGRPVIGLPGCARSPALNGADWVLARVACGVAVSGEDIARMGVGGLLKEIPTRPQPRAGRRNHR